jgi:hypothetical protein
MSRKESEILTNARLLMATATKHLVSDASGPYIKYPIIKQYCNTTMNNCIEDFADILLNENPYNGYKNKDDIDLSTDIQYNNYISHLKAICIRDQSNLNDDWIPASNVWFLKGLKAEAIVDIAIPSNGIISEIWIVSHTSSFTEERYNNIINAGFNVPIYEIKADFIIKNSHLSEKELYKVAQKKAKQWNLNTQYNNIDKDALLTFGKSIKKNDMTPCIYYPINNIIKYNFYNTYINDMHKIIVKFFPYKGSRVPIDKNNVSIEVYESYINHLKKFCKQDQYDLNDYWIPRNSLFRLINHKIRNTIVDIAIESDNSIIELWFIEDKKRVKQDDLNYIIDCGYAKIPIYQIEKSWIISNKDADNLYELAKQHATRWN